jgi:hypothetical protein
VLLGLGMCRFGISHCVDDFGIGLRRLPTMLYLFACVDSHVHFTVLGDKSAIFALQCLVVSSIVVQTTLLPHFSLVQTAGIQQDALLLLYQSYVRVNRLT